MSDFTVQIRALRDVEPHPDADRLDIAKVDDYAVVTMKGRYQNGDLAVYVPEQGVVPDEILQKGGFWKECEQCEGFGILTSGDDPTDLTYSETTCPSCKGRKGTGMLAGSKGDRVKPIRLRGIFSQGILLDIASVLPTDDVPDDEWREGDEVGDILGIKKYEVPIPAHLAGNVYAPVAPKTPHYTGNGLTTYTDIDNVKRYPDSIEHGEEVVMTEKLHGSCLIAFYDGERVHVSSKGMAGKGLALEDTKDESERSTNFYWRCLQNVDGVNALREISEGFGGVPVTLYGEALPCQDLKYGFDPGTATMRAFDIKIGPGYADHDVFVEVMDKVGIPRVPELYRGPFTREALAEHTDGKTTLGGAHVREGVVVKPVQEREAKHGRVILKSVSEGYLLRKNGTEHN